MSTIYIGMEHDYEDSMVKAFFRNMPDAVEWADKTENVIYAFRDTEGDLVKDPVFWTGDGERTHSYSHGSGGYSEEAARKAEQDKQLERRRGDAYWQAKRAFIAHWVEMNKPEYTTQPPISTRSAITYSPFGYEPQPIIPSEVAAQAEVIADKAYAEAT